MLRRSTVSCLPGKGLGGAGGRGSACGVRGTGVESSRIGVWIRGAAFLERRLTPCVAPLNLGARNA